ncbi:type II toxin-antitoxin system Phd/YefM family antitoxin [Patescibacteria group bacterium]|nr:type II toxin-antitoxin system Phd/YefM family antitoxin [Patescibacteria group bacterium]
MITVSATDAREKLYDLIEEVARSGKRIGITNKGETKVVLVSPEELDAWQVTAETLADKELMKAIKEGDSDFRAGRYSSLEEVEKELGLLDNKGDVPSKPFKSGKKRS